MSEAIITGVLAIVVCLINNIYQMRATAKAHVDTITLINYKIEKLTEKVEEHNNLVTRVYQCEQDTALQDAEIKRLNERVRAVEGR